MAESNLNFDTDVLPVVRRYARKAFSNDRDRSTKTADAVSEAWRCLQVAGPRATAKSIAWYAVQRVKVERHFQQSSRSVTGPNPRRRAKANRSGFDVGLLARESDDPANVAAMLIDFPAWFNDALKQRQREICTALIEGHTTTEVAERFGVTLGGVSYYRRWLVENWLAYTA